MQQLWAQDIEWDSPLPEDIFTAWERYYTSLPRIKDLHIPRNAVPETEHGQFELLGFSDASEKAYGACIYAISRKKNGKMHAHLICAKSRVAPLKKQSLPRLELEGALLLTRLYETTRRAFGERISEVRLWVDSTIVLGWLKKPPHTLKTFVANRVAKIQNKAREVSWYHVPSNQNPADLVSRGITLDELRNNQLWWNGPKWLTSEPQWPTNMKDAEVILPEVKTSGLALIATDLNNIFKKYDSYQKLQRTIAYCLRFRRNIRPEKTTGPLTPQELESADKTIARKIQQQALLHEFEDLSRGRELHNKSKLKALDPFLDKEKIIRVGGRLRHASISDSQKFPIILPPKNYVTTLIMRREHERLHHCPPAQLLSSIRQTYWPLNGRREATKIIKRCVRCFRVKPVAANAKMGDLPPPRVTSAVRPFKSCGVDYAGPLQVRESRRRGRVHISKGYIAVFTCLATKAVHLELVSELSTEAFLASLRRFVARRGICSQLFSDNGTNFVGAARELKEVYEFLKREKGVIETNLSKRRIEWHFIPPKAPHFGGLWEAVVKITKKHLFTVTQGRILTFEEYTTLLAEIEAILNSRPLSSLPEDPADLSPLTPAHFFVGDSLVSPVQINYIKVPENRLSRWKHLQKLKQEFWS